jgi:hypothetical protein
MRNWLIAAFLCAAPVSAFAATMPDQGGASGCQLRFEPNPGQWFVTNYNPFGAAAAAGDFDGLFVNDGGGVCSFQIGTDTAAEQFGLSRGGAGPRVGYTLYDVLSGDDLTPTSGHSRFSATQHRFTVGAHSQQLVKFHFESTEPFVGDGLYQQRMLIEADAADGSVVMQRPVVLGVQIEPQATISLSGAFRRVNGQADVDLGTLAPGLAKVPLNVHVRSTRAYVITSDSVNGGKLQMAGTGWSIPYELAFGGQQVAPAGGTYNGIPNGSSSVDNVQLGFLIGDTSGKAGGVYGDIVTLTVSVR